jgi:hypothetical protein
MTDMTRTFHHTCTQVLVLTATCEMSCFLNETARTTLLPSKTVQYANINKADKAEKVALSAQGKRTTVKRRGLSTVTDIEELIGTLVSTQAADGSMRLLPHTTASLYYRMGTTATHLNMLNDSEVIGAQTAASVAAASSETWRRFLGQQLMLLVELMIFCVPAFFADNAATITPLGKRKARGTVRTDLTLHTKMFVASRAKVDTATARPYSMHA